MLNYVKHDKLSCTAHSYDETDYKMQVKSQIFITLAVL